jgi:hypothetical protein
MEVEILCAQVVVKSYKNLVVCGLTQLFLFSKKTKRDEFTTLLAFSLG